MKRKYVCKAICGLICFALASLALVNEAKADGTEQLGPPSIAIAQGSQIVVAGTGLNDPLAQPGDITIEIPAGVTVAQVLLYWTGRTGSDLIEDTIQVNGMDVTGPRIGGPTPPPIPHPSQTYRADVTAEGWVVAGQVNVLSVEGLDFSFHNDGAAVVVILDDGSTTDMQILDGNDFASLLNGGMECVPVEFSFAPSADPQMGYIWLIVTDIDVPRPAAVDVTVGGVLQRLDVLGVNEGDYMQVVELEVPLPAGVSNVVVQPVSIYDDSGLDPSSLSWNFVSWELAEPDTPCGGGGLTPGFWQNKHGLGLIDEYGALADLNGLCLRDDDGAHADFTTLKEFRAWIKARRAKNMAYQLSGHLAAMYMNVLVGSVNGDALVYIGHEGDMISIDNLLNEANIALCEDGENRDYQEMLKDALDKANNNLNWVNPYPCSN